MVYKNIMFITSSKQSVYIFIGKKGININKLYYVTEAIK